MERENHINPELTGQAQNAYSNGRGTNMPEGAEGTPVGEQPDRIHPIRSSRPDADPKDQQRAREALERLMGGNPNDPITRALVDELARIGAGVLDINRGEDRSFRAQMNPDGDEQGNGAPHEENRESRNEEDPHEASAEERERAEFRRENPEGGQGAQAGDAEGGQTHADRRAVHERARGWAEERGKQRIVDILINPEKRNDYFNQIYAQVDSRPYDFWSQAFDQLNDGAEEYYFNQIVLNGSQGNWDEILTSNRFGANIPTRDEIQAALNEWNAHNNQQRTLQEVSQDLSLDFERFQKERQVRRTLHDVNAVLYLPTVKADQLFENMQQFDSASGDLALSMPGVRDMMGIYESVLREIMAENGGFLPDNQVRGKPTSILSGGGTANKVMGSEADRRTKERFKKLADAGLIMARAKNPTDGAWEKQMGGDIAQKDLNRIFTIARGMMIMEERLISLAAESRPPLDPATGKPKDVRFASGFLQDVIQSTSAYAHMFSKWGITAEALAAYLYEDKHDETVARYFKGWNPEQLKKLYEEYEKNPDIIYRDLESSFYLARRNPNRAGDIYTWVSWRGHLKPDVPSMMQDYLQSGQTRMDDRLNNPQTRALFEQGWKESHPGEVLPADFDNLLKNEYENWSGTGFRFELLRGDLAKFAGHGEDKEKFETAFEKAKGQIGRMVDLQPHRIYLVSRWVKERVDATLSPEQKQTLSEDLENLSMVEVAFLNAREKLLDKGKTFDSVTVERKRLQDGTWKNADMDEFYELAISEKKDRDGNIVETKEARIRRAKDLARKIREDFRGDGASNRGNQELYWKEFVFNRESTHGFVLWSGDTPADEYSFSALGATGGFVRRARDNANQAKATEAEVAMLDNLKNMNHPDQVISALYGVFQHIDHYSRDLGKKAIAEKAEGLIKFYKASWKTDIPIAGLAFFKGGKSSYAKMMYGEHAMSWEASDIKYFVEKMEHARMITKEDAHRLLKYTGGEKKHMAYEAGVGLSQLFALAMLLITVELAAKQGLKSEDIS